MNRRQSSLLRVTAATAFTLFAAACPQFTRPADAEHFDMLLRVVSGDKSVEAAMDTTPPVGGVNPRPVLRVKPGDPIAVTWRLKNNSPHGVSRGVTVHFFVVRQSKLAQKPVPDPAGDAGIVDNRFTTDMSRGAKSSGALRFKLSDPGNYLVRVQSEDTFEEQGHEHFSAVDVQVE